MANVIWLSNVCREARSLADIRYSESYPQKMTKMVRAGYVPSARELHDVAHWCDRDPVKPVCVQTIPFVTAEIKAIIEQFDIGNALFHFTEFIPPTEYPKWKVPDPMYALYAGNPRDTIIGEATVGYTPPYGDFKYGILPLFPKPGDIIGKDSALVGPDIWHDPNIGKGSFFMSDRLVKALKAAKMAKYFYPFRIPTS